MCLLLLLLVLLHMRSCTSDSNNLHNVNGSLKSTNLDCLRSLASFVCFAYMPACALVLSHAVELSRSAKLELPLFLILLVS